MTSAAQRRHCSYGQRKEEGGLYSITLLLAAKTHECPKPNSEVTIQGKLLKLYFYSLEPTRRVVVLVLKEEMWRWTKIN